MDFEKLKIDPKVTQHFQDAVRNAVRKLHDELPDRNMTRDRLIELVMTFAQQHQIDGADMIDAALAGKRPDDKRRYQYNMMQAVTGALLGALAECAMDNNTQWRDDDLFVAQYWNQVNNAIGRLRAADMAKQD